MTEMPEISSDANQERKQVTTKNSSSSTISSMIATVRFAKVRLLAYIGGMDFESEFSNLNGSYLKTVQYSQIKLENGLFNKKREFVQFYATPY